MGLPEIINLVTHDADTSRVLPPLQRMYFDYITTPFRFLRHSEDYKTATDLVRLERHITTKRHLQHLHLHSHALKTNALLEETRKKNTLTDYEKDTLITELVAHNRPAIAAALIADLLNRETRRDRFRWFLTFIVSLLSLIIALIFAPGGN